MASRNHYDSYKPPPLHPPPCPPIDPSRQREEQAAVDLIRNHLIPLLLSGHILLQKQHQNTNRFSNTSLHTAARAIRGLRDGEKLGWADAAAINSFVDFVNVEIARPLRSIPFERWDPTDAFFRAGRKESQRKKALRYNQFVEKEEERLAERTEELSRSRDGWNSMQRGEKKMEKMVLEGGITDEALVYKGAWEKDRRGMMKLLYGGGKEEE